MGADGVSQPKKLIMTSNRFAGETQRTSGAKSEHLEEKAHYV